VPAGGYIVGFSIIFVFLAIGVVAMKSNSRNLLAVVAGLMVGLLLGFFLAMLWAAFTGNLMMGEDEYQRRKEAGETFLYIIGYSGLIGAAIGLIQCSASSENKETQTSTRIKSKLTPRNM
jgi:hypothetical protein